MTRSLQPILLALVAALAIGRRPPVAAAVNRRHPSTDVNTLLSDTFKGNKDVKSGKLNLALKVDAKGARAASTGRLTSASRVRSRARASRSCPKFEIDFAFEGAGQSIKAGLTSTGDKGFVNFRGPTTWSPTRSTSSSRPATSRPRRTAAPRRSSSSRSPRSGSTRSQWLTNPKNEGDDEGRRRRHDQDHRRHRRQQAARRRQHRAAKTKRSASQGTQNLPSQLTAEQKQAGHRRDQGPEGRDLHRQGRQDPAPDGGLPRDRRLPRAPTRARPPSTSTSRSPTSTRIRRSPSRPTPSRSTSCSRSSAGSASAASVRPAARRQPQRRRHERQRVQPEAREVLEVRHRRPAATSPRRASAQKLLTG